MAPVRTRAHEQPLTASGNPDGELDALRARIAELEAELAARRLHADKDSAAFRKSEDALAQAHRQFSESFRHAPIGVALVSPAGQWLRVNRALCDIVGYTEEELLRLTFQDITHPDDLETDLQLVEQMLRGEIQTYQMNKRYLQRDGRVIWVQLNVALVRDIQGAPVHFISQIQDITEAREHLERVESLNTELRQLLDTFSHDLNEPVRKLAVHAARLREAIRSRDLGRALRSIDVLESEAGRLGEVHDGLLQYLRFATQPLRLERVDLSALITQQAGRLRARVQALGADLQVSPLPAVYVDRAMLATVLHNLLDNALKYHRPDERPSICVYADVSPGTRLVTVCIRDNGSGIPEAHMASALHIFRRVAGRSSGTDPGVGLAICRKILERHGGALALRSNGDQPGLTVVLTLPSLQSPQAAGPAASA